MDAPVAMVHGFLGQPSMWTEVTRELRRGVELCRLPGHGLEPWFAEQPTMASAADALARQLPFDEPALLVGYSMGGRLALTTACLHPGRIAGVVAIGAHPGLRSPEEQRARRAWDDEQADRLIRDGLETFVHAWEAQPLFA